MTAQESLAAVVREVEAHAARSGWDQPAQLFALVETADLARREPQLAALLGLDESAELPPEHLTPVEQEQVEQSLQELLPTILWPAEVVGCAVVVEATSLPDTGDAPLDETAAELAASAPDREETRIVAGALRTGETWCAIRQRAHDEDDMVLTGADLVPGLLELVHATLEPDPTPAESDTQE